MSPSMRLARMGRTFAMALAATGWAACAGSSQPVREGLGAGDSGAQGADSHTVSPVPPRPSDRPTVSPDTGAGPAMTAADAAESPSPDAAATPAVEGPPLTPPVTPASAPPGYVLLLEDPLTSAAPVYGEDEKTSTEGEFTPQGWQSKSMVGMLVIGLEKAQGFEGILEVDITNLDWLKANTGSATVSPKIHFINMFSNRLGDHHVEQGGEPDDALWTLRGGIANGDTRYGDTFKVLWASKGAKRTPGSDYHEGLCGSRSPAGWTWSVKERYTFQITWSSKAKKWSVVVNGRKFCENPWNSQVEPLKYVFLGKAADFGSMIGPYFSNLRVYAPAPTN